VKVSAIIPVYNGERYLRATLESVFAQTYPLHEIVVVDDGSTDTSPQILKSYGDRLTVIRQDNLGIAGARNTGLANATGEAFAFLDQDDLWPSGRTRLLAAALQAASDIDVVVGLSAINYERSKPPVHSWEVKTMHREYLLGSQLIRSRVFATLGDFNMNVGYGDDTDFWVRRLEKKVKRQLLDEVTIVYRVHDHNTSINEQNSRFHMLAVLRNHLNRARLPDHDDKLHHSTL
jgi:glycosyltransferase involved in cell wall biosynthesis